MRLVPLALALTACAAVPAVPERSAAGAAPGRRAGASPPAYPPPVPPPAAPPSAGPPSRPPPAPGDGRLSARERLVAAARSHLGQYWPSDCSDFVERVHAEAGMPLVPRPARSASEGLWRASRPVERPRPGDLAFFHDTFDRNRDGRRGDRFTHVAMVEAVEGPRVVLIHRGSRGITRLTMNLSRRHDPAENGWLRKRRAGDPPGGAFLSGELFAAWGTAVPVQPAERWGAAVTQSSPPGRAAAPAPR